MNLSGVLFFPVTPFDADGELAEDVLAEHIGRGLEHGPGACSRPAAPASSPRCPRRSTRAAVRVAVETTGGRVPVFAGAGGPLGAALSQARGRPGRGRRRPAAHAALPGHGPAEGLRRPMCGRSPPIACR